MGTRTVRLDDETERTLAEITAATGLSVSAALKQGLTALRERIKSENATLPYAIYQELDLGPGGYVAAASAQTKNVVREKIRRKIQR